VEKWRAYERLIALLSTDEYDNHQYTVIPNARIKGLISNRKRQLDVLIDFRYDSNLSRRIIIDAKDRKRPIDIKEVEAFEGLMKDVKAKRGILVCSNGHTKSALKRAQKNIGIKIVSSNDIEDLDLNSWDKCLSYNCEKGLVLWDVAPGIFIHDQVFVQAIGKCDECGEFQVWCWSCGNKKSLNYEEEWRCSCEGPWFWLTAIEDEFDKKGKFLHKVALLLLITLGSDIIHTMDRRPL
jgi:rhodanese-related sulfurtransferase